MGKTLIVAEKPSVGRDIARVLGCGVKGDGFLSSERYVVSWAIGHLVTLAEPEDYDAAYKKWSVATLPIIPAEMKLKPVPKTKAQLNILKKLLRSPDIDDVICATDSGREGELIFRYIYTICKCGKPFRRLWISSMTDAAVKAGFDSLKPGEQYDNLYVSARCRSEADWLVGMNATRAYTIRYDALLSVGRVQTPTLAILVAKEKEIRAFVPQDYWEVKADFEAYHGLWFDPATKETKITDEAKAKAIKSKVKGQPGFVEDIETEEKKQPPSLLYDLTELQRDANRLFGFSAQKTLDTAQALYEKRKMITYPRTDSRYLSDDMVPKLPIILRKLSETAYGKWTEYVRNLPKLPISKRIVDNSKVTDHHAIIPTEALPKIEALTADEAKVYGLIARRFISVFYPNYVYSITRITTNVLDERFLTKGTTVLEWGYMALYKDLRPEKKEKDEDDVLLPDAQKGQAVACKDAAVARKKTSPPKPYTEATLLSAMENAGRFVEDEALKEQMKDSGLGTPATRAAIIERLLGVGYIVRKGKSLIPTEKGMLLIDVVPPEMKSPETTGKWEKGLSAIAKGNMDDRKFMQSIVRYVRFLVESSKTRVPGVAFPKEARRGKAGKRGEHTVNFGKCPACGEGLLLENSKSFYCSRWREGCKLSYWKDKINTYADLPEGVLKALKNTAEGGGKHAADSQRS